MILELLIMNGYGALRLVNIFITLINFLILYKITSSQFNREYAKFAEKYKSLNSDKITLAGKQSTNRTFVRTAAHKI